MPWLCHCPLALLATAFRLKVLVVSLSWPCFPPRRVSPRLGDPPALITRRLHGAMQLGYIEGEEIHSRWRILWILHSWIIAALGAYIALSTVQHMRRVRTNGWYCYLLLQAGLGLGFCTVWCMHFVGMQALQLKNGSISGNMPEIEIVFEVSFTISSGLAAWLISTISLHICHGCKFQHAQVVRNRESALRIVLATSILSTGVCVMHYMGMMSQRGDFKMLYNPIVVVVSVVIAIVVSAAGLCIVVFLPNKTMSRVAASVVIAFAVTGMHYCGMASAHYIATTDGPTWGLHTVRVTPKDVLVAVLVVDILLMVGNAYYIEVIEKIEVRHEQQLLHEGFIAGAKKLVKRSKEMRFPMVLIRYQVFAGLGRLVPHETLRDQYKLVFVDTGRAAAKLRKTNVIVFFSHQWLSEKVPDPQNVQYDEMLIALTQLAQVMHMRPDNLLVWVDYSCIPQHAVDQQQLAIESLPAYASVCSAFVVIAPQVLHSQTKVPCNFTSYSQRFWCRLEVFCTILSAVRMGACSDQIESIEEVQEGTNSNSLTLDGVTSRSEVCQLDSNQGLVGLNDKQRIFLVLQGRLQRLSFFGAKGLLPEYEKLLYVYEGELDCCKRSHVSETGEIIPCDRTRLVETLAGCYGAMLMDLQRMKQKKRKLSPAEEAAMAMAEIIVSQRKQIFPKHFFTTRINAMHEFVSSRQNCTDNRATRRESISGATGNHSFHASSGKDTGESENHSSEVTTPCSHTDRLPDNWEDMDFTVL